MRQNWVIFLSKMFASHPKCFPSVLAVLAEFRDSAVNCITNFFDFYVWGIPSTPVFYFIQLPKSPKGSKTLVHVCVFNTVDAEYKLNAEPRPGLDNLLVQHYKISSSCLVQNTLDPNKLDQHLFTYSNTGVFSCFLSLFNRTFGEGVVVENMLSR